MRAARLILHKQWEPYRYLPGKLASRDTNSAAPCKKLDYACLCLVGKGFLLPYLAVSWSLKVVLRFLACERGWFDFFVSGNSSLARKVYVGVCCQKPNKDGVHNPGYFTVNNTMVPQGVVGVFIFRAKRRIKQTVPGIDRRRLEDVADPWLAGLNSNCVIGSSDAISAETPDC